jgi:malate permease and related proteins
LGNPIAEGIYGSIGLLYASIYLIPLRIVMWTAGISYFTGNPDKKIVLKQVLTHPCIIATELGIIIMLFQIPLPTFLSETISSVGGCTTATSMILIGTILADANLRTMISKVTVVFTAIRLILIPSLVLAGCLLFGIDPLIMGVAVILAAMPAGSTTAILAAKYDGDAEFATKCVVLSTILSMVAIPLWSMMLSWIR